MLDGYDEFRTYIIVGTLKDTTNFGRLVVLHRMTLEASRVVSRLSCNNNNTTVSSNFLVPYLRESYTLLLSPVKQLQ